MKSFALFAVVASLALSACATPTPPARVVAAPVPIKYVAPQTGLNNSGLDTILPATLDKIVKTALEEAVAPGVAIAVGRNGHIAYMKGYGNIDWNKPGSPAVDTNTLYDLASLTKVIATTTVAMILEENGQLDLNRTVSSYLPEVNSPEKAQITGKTLDRLANEKVFKPLGMTDTQFQPPISLRPRIAPTQTDDARGGLLWGTVHDENAWAMGG